jgi:hypothetical protein
MLAGSKIAALHCDDALGDHELADRWLVHIKAVGHRFNLRRTSMKRLVYCPLPSAWRATSETRKRGRLKSSKRVAHRLLPLIQVKT